jgi:hypothetical protein
MPFPGITKRRRAYQLDPVTTNNDDLVVSRGELASAIYPMRAPCRLWLHAEAISVVATCASAEGSLASGHEPERRRVAPTGIDARAFASARGATPAVSGGKGGKTLAIELAPVVCST